MKAIDIAQGGSYLRDNRVQRLNRPFISMTILGERYASCLATSTSKQLPSLKQPDRVQQYIYHERRVLEHLLGLCLDISTPEKTLVNKHERLDIWRPINDSQLSRSPLDI